MKVFVTGGSSPLGELVVPRLARDHEVTALARSDASAALVEERGATAVRGDLSVPGEWASAVGAADAVVHLAGIRRVGPIVELVRPDQPLTVISSASVRNPAHPKSAELVDAEDRLTAAKPQALVILRPTMIYGSSQDRNVRVLARLLRRLPVTPRLVGGGVIQPVLADDVADAVAVTLGTPGRLAADLGGPEAVRVGVLVDGLARRLGRRRVPIPIPVSLLVWGGEVASKRRRSKSLHAVTMLRHDRAIEPAGAAVLGHPPTPLPEGLDRAVARYRF